MTFAPAPLSISASCDSSCISIDVFLVAVMVPKEQRDNECRDESVIKATQSKAPCAFNA